MRKRIYLLFIFMLVSAAATAQKLNSVRIGVGISLIGNSYMDKRENGDRLKVGPAISIAYNREINKYFSVEAKLSADCSRTGNTFITSHFVLSANALVTPLAKWFRYFELGIGIAGRYCLEAETAKPIEIPGGIATVQYSLEEVTMGVNFCARLYAIRNDKFDLFAFYEPQTIITKNFKNHFWRTSDVGVCFGVKF